MTSAGKRIWNWDHDLFLTHLPCVKHFKCFSQCACPTQATWLPRSSWSHRGMSRPPLISSLNRAGMFFLVFKPSVILRFEMISVHHSTSYLDVRCRKVRFWSFWGAKCCYKRWVKHVCRGHSARHNKHTCVHNLLINAFNLSLMWWGTFDRIFSLHFWRKKNPEW